MSTIRTAWAEDPALAIELVTRFPSAKVRQDVRWLLVNFPEKAIGVADGISLLLGSAIPNDISYQLKVQFAMKS